MLYFATCSFFKWTILCKHLVDSSIEYSFALYTSFSPLLLPYFNKNLMAFVSFLMLHHFSGIIYLILFALYPLRYHLEETSKLIYSTKPFLLRLSLYQKFFGFWLLCTLAILSGQVGFEPQFTGGVSNL